MTSQMGTGDTTNPGVAERHILKAQEDLWLEAVRLAALVETTLVVSVGALLRRRPAEAAEIKESEREIDRREVEIERECLRILALYEPVASDFRRMLTVLRMNRDLERIGDLAARIAKDTRKAAKLLNLETIPDALDRLAEGARDSVREALDALTRADSPRAQQVIAGDSNIDRDYRDARVAIKEAIRSAPENLEGWLKLLEIARRLERIADHAVNIAETAIFLGDGQIVRHARTRRNPS